MKQRITNKDLQELSDKQRVILTKWAGEYNEKIGGYSPVDSILNTNEPELNIGQLIEFLKEKKGLQQVDWGDEELCDLL